jgi:HK97 family phage major capsid protein
MVLYIGQKMQLLKRAHQREQHINEMQNILSAAKKENRAFTDDETKKFEGLEQKVQGIDAELEKNNTSLEELMTDMEERTAKIEAIQDPEAAKKKKTETRSIIPSEVRSYKKGERMGNGSNNITMGDIIVAHTTGKFRTPEIRQLLTTNSGGVTINEEVYAGFIDLLRANSFLGEFTNYKMDSKTLTIPRVFGDVAPNFKLESAEIPLSSPVFTGATLEAKYLYCLTEISLELLESSSIDIGAAVNEIMSKSMMTSIQRFALAGSAPNGFAGIINDTDINKIDAAVSYASIGAGIQAVQSVNGEATSLVINPTDWMGLQLLTDGGGGQFIEPPKFLEDVNLIVTNSIDAGQALVGNLSTIGMGINSAGGLQLDVNAAPGFTRGVVHIRARFSGDVVLTDPKQLALIDAVAI